MAVYSYLDASSAHISEVEAKALNLAPHFLAEYAEGWFFYVGDGDDFSHRRNEGFCAKCGGECIYDDQGRTTQSAGWPNLGVLLVRAREEGCYLLRIDADGDVLDGLPTYDW